MQNIETKKKEKKLKQQKKSWKLQTKKKKQENLLCWNDIELRLYT